MLLYCASKLSTGKKRSSIQFFFSKVQSARIILRMFHPLRRLYSVCLNERPHFPIALVSLLQRTVAVISFSTGGHTVCGRYLRFRRACGKLRALTEAPLPCHTPAGTHTSSCVVKLECGANERQIFLCARGRGKHFIHALAPTTSLTC